MEVNTLIWSIVYLSCVLLANYTATWFIPLPIFGLLSVGTILFGATFTARDYTHRKGRQYVYTMILVTALMMGVMSIVLEVPIRIIIASIVAILISESADTEIYQTFIKNSWMVRVVSSNLVSIPLDSMVFNLIAFLGVFSIPMLVAIIFGEIVTKFLAGLVIALWKYLS